MYQFNINNNIYIGEVFVGNPPQTIRAVFDTGSTNTWILNKSVDLNGKDKQFSFDDAKSKSLKKSDKETTVTFGSGKLGGHFYQDDIRIGSCDVKSNG
jgi:hypothetical protein